MHPSKYTRLWLILQHRRRDIGRATLAAMREANKKQPRRRGRSFARAAPACTFWLVDGGKYVGLVQVRVKPSSSVDPRLKNHVYYEIRPSMRKKGYGAAALGLALEKAPRYGLAHVILVCRKGNTGSRKIIEKNGGKLLRAVRVRGYPQPFLKYRIDLNRSCVPQAGMPVLQVTYRR